MLSLFKALSRSRLLSIVGRVLGGLGCCRLLGVLYREPELLSIVGYIDCSQRSTVCGVLFSVKHRERGLATVNCKACYTY